jgi:hypothetical protein
MTSFKKPKWVIRIRNLKQNGQHNGQKKKDKRTNNDLQNLTYITKNRVLRTPQKNKGELRYSGRVGSSCSTSSTRHISSDFEIQWERYILYGCRFIRRLNIYTKQLYTYSSHI